MSAGTTTTSTHDRLLLACARLRRYGILAAGRTDGDPAEIRRGLAEAILDRFPDAACSFVFWTTDAATAFDGDGRLVRDLVLHYNGPPVARAVRAALAENGLTASEGPEPLTLVVEADRNS